MTRERCLATRSSVAITPCNPQPPVLAAQSTQPSSEASARRPDASYPRHDASSATLAASTIQRHPGIGTRRYSDERLPSRLARAIHECRREAFETEAPRGFSHVRPTQAYLQSVEEAEREQLRRARGSDDAVGIHEPSGLERIRRQTVETFLNAACAQSRVRPVSQLHEGDPLPTLQAQTSDLRPYLTE